MIFKNIFAVAYRYYSRSVYEDAYFAAIVLISAIQFFILNFFICLMQKIFNINIIKQIEKPVFIGVVIMLAIINFIMYPKKRVGKILSNFEMKHKRVRVLWGYVTVVLFLAPLILIILLTKK